MYLTLARLSPGLALIGRNLRWDLYNEYDLKEGRENLEAESHSSPFSLGSLPWLVTALTTNNMLQSNIT